MDQIVTLKKLVASLIKGAYEEGAAGKVKWEDSQAKAVHDRFLMEDFNVKTNMASS